MKLADPPPEERISCEVIPPSKISVLPSNPLKCRRSEVFTSGVNSEFGGVKLFVYLEAPLLILTSSKLPDNSAAFWKLAPMLSGLVVP